MAKADWDDEGLYLDSIFNFPEESMESWEGDEWDAFASHKLGPIPEDFVIDPTEIAQTTNAPLTPSYPLKSCTTPETYQFDDTDGLYILQPDESNAVQAEGTFRSPDEVQEAYTFPSSDEIQQADTFRSTNEVQEAYTFPSSDEIQEADTFRSPSPVSVLSKRKRSKRARPSGPSQWNLSLPFLNTKRASDAKKANIRRRKTASNQTSSDYANPEYAAELRLTKKCAHCEITKTPQWREGPLGPKTLCNACGVRYRSGRLFPEYRPAASPTFVPSIHSNSHKKVVEMRNRGKHQVDKIEQALPPQIEFNPVFSCLCDHTRL